MTTVPPYERKLSLDLQLPHQRGVSITGLFNITRGISKLGAVCAWQPAWRARRTASPLLHLRPFTSNRHHPREQLQLWAALLLWANSPVQNKSSQNKVTGQETTLLHCIADSLSASGAS